MPSTKRTPALRDSCGCRPKEPHTGRRGVAPAFRKLVEAHDWRGKRVVDIGCGSGAATVLVAKLGADAVGVDLDPLALMEAGERAVEEGAKRARFACADAELADYRELAESAGGLDGVLAHLCFSREIARRAALALRPGGVLVVRCFDHDMWKEAGAPGPFAFTGPELRRFLGTLGLEVTHLEVERRTQTFASIEAFVEEFLADPGRRARWEEDGRLATLKRAFARGNRKLTEAFLVVEARKGRAEGPAARPRRSLRKS